MSVLPSPTDSDQNVVWVVDGDHSFFDALTWIDPFQTTTVKVFSVYDVVRACQNAAITNSVAVDYLVIFGHGTGGYQSAGAGKKYEDTGTRSFRFRTVSRPGESLLMGPAEKALSALNGVLADEAEVLLAGCNVGEGDSGTGLLTTVSNILGGRSVKGFENAVYWWTSYMVGYLKEAQGESVSSSLSSIKILV